VNRLAPFAALTTSRVYIVQREKERDRGGEETDGMY